MTETRAVRTGETCNAALWTANAILQATPRHWRFCCRNIEKGAAVSFERKFVDAEVVFAATTLYRPARAKVTRRTAFAKGFGSQRGYNAQWPKPIIRTEGSFTKMPTVVRRPLLSISRRSIYRSGEAVAVPTGSNRTRCGISEPVTKTVTSCAWTRRSGSWITGSSASSVPANTVTATTINALGSIVFTTYTTPAMLACKFRRQ
jgi:hypothetical protein